MFVIIQTTYSARFTIAIACWKKTLILALKQTNKSGVGYYLELFWLFLFLCLGYFLLWKKICFRASDLMILKNLTVKITDQGLGLNKKFLC